MRFREVVVRGVVSSTSWKWVRGDGKTRRAAGGNQKVRAVSVVSDIIMNLLLDSLEGIAPPASCITHGAREGAVAAGYRSKQSWSFRLAADFVCRVIRQPECEEAINGSMRYHTVIENRKYHHGCRERGIARHLLKEHPLSLPLITQSWPTIGVGFVNRRRFGEVDGPTSSPRRHYPLPSVLMGIVPRGDLRLSPIGEESPPPLLF